MPEDIKLVPMDGRYYAEGRMVLRAPIKTDNADGTSSISIGFPVCKMHEAAADQAAIMAFLLNQGSAAKDLLDALRTAVADYDKSIEALRAAFPAQKITTEALWVAPARAAIAKSEAIT